MEPRYYYGNHEQSYAPPLPQFRRERRREGLIQHGEADEEFGWAVDREEPNPQSGDRIRCSNDETSDCTLSNKALLGNPACAIFLSFAFTLVCLIVLRPGLMIFPRYDGQQVLEPNEWEDPNLTTAPILEMDVSSAPRLYSYNAGVLQWEQVGEDLEHMAMKEGDGRYYAVALAWDGRPVEARAPPNHWQPTLSPPAPPPRQAIPRQEPSLSTAHTLTNPSWQTSIDSDED